MAKEFSKQRQILELYRDGEIYAKTASDYAYAASSVMNDFKDKIYARELLAKAVELLSGPQETFFVLDILSDLEISAFSQDLRKAIKRTESRLYENRWLLKKTSIQIQQKERAAKAVENAKTRTEILYAAADVLDIFKDKGWAIEIVKSGIIAAR